MIIQISVNNRRLVNEPVRLMFTLPLLSSSAAFQNSPNIHLFIFRTTAKKDNDLMTVDSPTNPPDPSTNAWVTFCRLKILIISNFRQPDSDLEHHPIINEGKFNLWWLRRSKRKWGKYLFLGKSSSKSHSTLGERILTRVLQRQPAVDVPDEIGDHNAKVLQSQASFVLDDFTSHPRAAKNICKCFFTKLQ